MSVLVLEIHDRRGSDPSLNTAPVGVQNRGSFPLVYR